MEHHSYTLLKNCVYKLNIIGILSIYFFFRWEKIVICILLVVNFYIMSCKYFISKDILMNNSWNFLCICSLMKRKFRFSALYAWKVWREEKKEKKKIAKKSISFLSITTSCIVFSMYIFLAIEHISDKR